MPLNDELSTQNCYSFTLPPGSRPSYNISVIVYARNYEMATATITTLVTVYPIQHSEFYNLIQEQEKELYNYFLLKDSYSLNYITHCLSHNIIDFSVVEREQINANIMWYILQSMTINCSNSSLRTLFSSILNLATQSFTSDFIDLVIQAFLYVQNECKKSIDDKIIEQGYWISNYVLMYNLNDTQLTEIRCFLEFLKDYRTTGKVCGQFAPDIITPNIKLKSLLQFRKLFIRSDQLFSFENDQANYAIVPYSTLGSVPSLAECWVSDFVIYYVDVYAPLQKR